jgi:hypothetical protein
MPFEWLNASARSFAISFKAEGFSGLELAILSWSRGSNFGAVSGRSKAETGLRGVASVAAMGVIRFRRGYRFAVRLNVYIRLALWAAHRKRTRGCLRFIQLQTSFALWAGKNHG